jgi:hypothetical protein
MHIVEMRPDEEGTFTEPNITDWLNSNK